MPKISESSRTRLRKTELDQIEKDLPKVRIGLPGIVWAGLSVFMIMLTILLLLLMDGRNVVHAAEKGNRPWSSAIESGDWETVRKLAKAEVDKNPRDAGAQHALGLSLMELRRFDEAEIPLITAESISPGITDYKITLADLYSRRGVPQLASGKLREALDLDPSLVQIHWRLARTLYALKEYDESLEELRLINQLEPENWDAYRLTADVAMGRKKYDEAVQNLKLYTAVVPDARGWAKLATAYMFLTPPDTANARRAAETALSIDPGDTQAHVALARIRLIQMSQKGLSSAVSTVLAEDALAHYAETASYIISARDAAFMSKLHELKKDMAGAETALRIAAAIDTTNKDYSFNLASNLMAQNKFDEARGIYQKVIALDPRNAAAYVNWGIAERQAGDPDAAMKAFQKAIEIDPKYAPAYKNLGDIHKDKGNGSDALENYRQAGELAGTDKVTCAAAWDAHGYTLYEKGDYAGAVESLRKALVCDDCHVHAVLTLASAYQKLGQVPEACAVLKEAASCRGNDPEIRKALAGYGCK